MGLFSRLLGHRRAGPAKPASAREPAPPSRHAGGAAFDATLIAMLKGHHHELLRTCSAIQTATTEHRFNDIENLLKHLKQTFQRHVAMENARFYAYVHPRVSHDKAADELIAAMRKESNEAGFELLKVVDVYTAYPPTYLTEAQFRYEFDQAAALLVKHMEKVQVRLYPLYRP